MKRVGNGSSILSFFKRQKKSDPDDNDVPDAIPLSSTSVTNKDTKIDDITPDEKLLHDHNVTETRTPPHTWNAETFDIADIKKETLDDNTKLLVLKSVLLPKQPYTFPFSQGKTQKRKFQEKWICDPTLGFPFLAYSKKEDAVYCKPCFLFFHEGVGKGGHEVPGQLVTKGFREWKKAKEIFIYHSTKLEYHKNCVAMADQFINVMSGKQNDVCSQIDSKHAREKEENRAALRPIVETILFCAEQELPLRGDVDSGLLSLEKPVKKDGKFRSLLRFRANAGDENLRKHVINCSKNATYISPQIQNEVIQTCCDLVTEEVVSRINSSNCFAILADETMDVSGTEQLSQCIRYIDSNNSNENSVIVREDFVGFIPIYNLNAENITKVILDKCSSLGLDMNKCVGQGYDGAAAMAGHLTGVQTRVKEQYPKARYFHCASHRLNLALSDTFSNTYVRNCLGTMKEITNLFRNNTLANDLLQTNILIHVPDTKKKRLTRLCETRFIERHDSVITFVELFRPIVVSLEELSQKPLKVSSSASNFLASVEKSEFIVSMFVCEQLFSCTMPLSIFLQEKNLDMASAMTHAKNLLQSLMLLRAEAEKSFVNIFSSANDLSKDVFGCELKLPRLAKRQAQRANPETNSPFDYFRIGIYVPCVDALITNITQRFVSNDDVLTSFQIILPGFTSPAKVNQLEKLSEYLEEFPMAAVKSEYLMWCNVASEMKEGTEVLKILGKCDKIYYRSIHYLLTVLATLPVITCSVERSFSTMKRVKSVCRSLMSNDRLAGLAMLSIHWDVSVDVEQVIDRMAGKKKRRLLL